MPFLLVVLAAIHRMCRLAHELRIPDGSMVTGELTIEQPGARLDLISEEREAIPLARN